VAKIVQANTNQTGSLRDGIPWAFQVMARLHQIVTGDHIRADLVQGVEHREGGRVEDNGFPAALAVRQEEAAAVEVDVARGGEHVTTLRPQRNFHFAQRQPQSEVAIRTTPIEDLYLVVTSVDPDGDIALRAFVNPLTWWIWVGAGVMGAGIGVILSSPAPVGARKPSPRRIEEPAVVMR
jgi:hypothetical protein